MVKKGVIISSVFIAIGALLILNAFSGMTGFVVLEEVGVQASTVLGLILFLGGIMLTVYESSQRDFKTSIENIVNMYSKEDIDDLDAVERINSLRAGKQIEAVKYAGGKALVFVTRRGEVPVRIDDLGKALKLMTAAYFTSIINDRGNMDKSKIEIARGKIPYLDNLKGGITEYMKQYGQERVDDLRRLASSAA